MSEVPAVIAAEQQCMFGSSSKHCGQQALLHVLQEDGAPTMSCTEHAPWWNRHAYQDTHFIASDCGMPAMFWHHSTPAGLGTCSPEPRP